MAVAAPAVAVTGGGEVVAVSRPGPRDDRTGAVATGGGTGGGPQPSTERPADGGWGSTRPPTAGPGVRDAATHRDRPAPETERSLPPISRWPAVSVVIPARDCADTLPAAVRSALEQRFDGSLEVVVAAAPSQDDTLAVAQQLAEPEPQVRYRVNHAGTTPAGLNLAIATARGEVLVRLDAHAWLPAGYVARALELLRETGAANVGGLQIPVAGPGFGRAVAAAMSSPLGSGGARYRVGGPPGDVETVYLGVFHAHALAAVGGFDDSLERNQDSELNHRLRTAGYRVYFHPDLRAYYRPRTTPGDLWRQFLGNGAWKRHTLVSRPAALRARQVAAPLLVAGLVAGGVLAGLGQPWPLVGLGGLWLAALTAGALAATVGRAARSGSATGADSGRPAGSVSDRPPGGDLSTGGRRSPREARDGPGGDATRERRLGLVPAVVLALAIMHLAWGVGFLVGRRRTTTPRRGSMHSDEEAPAHGRRQQRGPRRP